MEVKTEEFKGKPVITFKEGNRVMLAFGLKKARIILNHLKEIQEFIDIHTPKESPAEEESEGKKP